MSIEISIKTINNDTYKYTVEPCLPVRELKQLVERSTSIPSDRQRLIFRGQVLQDDSDLATYRIEDGHAIHMVARPANMPPSPERPSAATASSLAAPRSSDRQAPPLARNLSSPHWLSGMRAMPAIPPQLPASSPQRQSMEPLWPVLEQTAAPVGRNTAATHPVSASLGNTAQGVLAGGRTNHSLEHVRQGLLTMHTIRASMPTSLQAARSDVNETFAAPAGFRRQYYLGQWLDVKDTVNQWLEATVMRIDNVARRIFVHYNGWPVRWDEWIDFDSPRLSPFRTRSAHVGASLCPMPNTIASLAPSTGRDDVRLILPALLDMYEYIGPLLREAVVLSAESLLEAPDAFDNTLPPVPNGQAQQIVPEGSMPWDGDESTATATSSVAARSNALQDDSGIIDGVDHEVDQALREQRYASTERLVNVSRALVPFLDRLGRVMSDIAPHLDLEFTPPGQPNASGTAGAAGSSAAGGSGQRVEEETDEQSALRAAIATLPPALQQLLQPRPPSPPPELAYRQPINSVSNRLGGSGMNVNRMLDIHIHAIVTPQRPVAQASPLPAPSAGAAPFPSAYSSPPSQHQSVGPELERFMRPAHAHHVLSRHGMHENMNGLIQDRERESSGHESDDGDQDHDNRDQEDNADGTGDDEDEYDDEEEDLDHRSARDDGDASESADAEPTEEASVLVDPSPETDESVFSSASGHFIDWNARYLPEEAIADIERRLADIDARMQRARSGLGLSQEHSATTTISANSELATGETLVALAPSVHTDEAQHVQDNADQTSA